MDEWEDISRSSWLDAAKYDEVSRSLFLRLKTGVEVEFLDVAPRVWRAFMSAPSRGRFVHSILLPQHVKRVVT